MVPDNFIEMVFLAMPLSGLIHYAPHKMVSVIYACRGHYLNLATAYVKTTNAARLLNYCCSSTNADWMLASLVKKVIKPFD